MSMIDVSDTERRIAERVNPVAAGTLELSQQAGGLGFVSMADAMEFAKVMAISSVAIPKHLRGNVGACLAVTIQAVEWKCSPFAVANKSYSVNDRLAYESQLVQAVILQRAPIKGRFKVEYIGDGDKRKCKVIAELKDGGSVEYESPEIGKIPVKNSPLWKGDPDQQLFYYSGRALCRRHFPDVLLGIYTPEEMEDDEPPRRGPDRARDVTPPKTVAEKLDALADVRETIEHDAEMGEIVEEQQQPNNDKETGANGPKTDAPQAASEPAGAASAKTEPDAADSSETLSEDEQLLAEARANALDGRRIFDTWFAGLHPDKCDVLRPHMKSLMAAANKADGK